MRRYARLLGVSTLWLLIFATDRQTSEQRRQRLLASKKRRKQSAAKKREVAREEVVEHPIADCDCAE